MSKKDKKKKKRENQNQNVYEASQKPISKRGWKIIGIGIGLVTLGFIVLSFTDPRGQNFASTLSPFLLVGGYTTIGFGIIANDKSPN